MPERGWSVVRVSSGLVPRQALLAALPAAFAALTALPIEPAIAMPAPTPGAPEAVRQGYEKVAREILCYCGCARQSIYDCTCGTAHELRDRIEGELKAGRSSDEIIAGFVKEQGEQVRVVPTARGFNRLAWAGPGIAILLGAAGVAWLLARWSSRPAERDIPPLHPVPTEEEEKRAEAYRRKLERDLSKVEP